LVAFAFGLHVTVSLVSTKHTVLNVGE
jgi:hypothetical protein